jgi:CheY-like chemotaxis protein
MKALKGTLDSEEISSVNRKRKMVRQEATAGNNSTFLPEDLHMFRSRTQGMKIQDDFNRGAECSSEQSCLAIVDKKANPNISSSIIQLKDLGTAVLESVNIHPDIELDLELKAGGPLYIESNIQCLQNSLRYLVECLADLDQDNLDRTITMKIEHSSQNCVFTIVVFNNTTCSQGLNSSLSRNAEHLVFEAYAKDTEIEIEQKCKSFSQSGREVFSVCKIVKSLNGNLGYYSTPEVATFILSIPQTLNSVKTERIVFTKIETPSNRFDRPRERGLSISLDHKKVIPNSMHPPKEALLSSFHLHKEDVQSSLIGPKDLLPKSPEQPKDVVSSSVKEQKNCLPINLSQPKEPSSISFSESKTTSNDLSFNQKEDSPTFSEDPPPKVIQNSPLVLVVEDTPVCARLLCTILRQFKCTTKWVENGQEALDELRESPEIYSLVLMDLRMPVMDGLTATRIIKVDLKLTVPIVALTGESGSQIQEDCKDIGFDDFFNKPLKKAQLIKLVEVHTGYIYEPTKL